MKFLPIPSARWLPMPADTGPRVITSTQIPDVPLNLIPKTIADQIKGKYKWVYRITAIITFQNRFTLIIETRNRTRRRISPGDLAGCKRRGNG
jgi:hypothetical protein